MHTASRYHDFSCGHRVSGHESKCAYLHGHNYRIHFHCVIKELVEIGRVVDFSVIKSTLCEWLEENWDHKFLLWEQDPYVEAMMVVDGGDSIVLVPFNPTAENMAEYLVNVVAPKELGQSGVILRECVIEETRKCSASYQAD